MDSGAQWRRDPATGELRVLALGNAPGDTAAAPTIRVGVNLVEVGCNVFGPDGNSLPGLMREDFRVFENGVEQRVAYFDASTEPLHLAVILDASPSVLRDEAEMKQAARALLNTLSPADEVAVTAFAAHTFLILGFTRDHAQVEHAIASVDVRRLAADTGGSNIYQAVALTAGNLFPKVAGRKAVVLLTDGQDSGLGLNWDPRSAAPPAEGNADRLTFEDVARLLAAEGVEVYAISTEPRPRVMTAAWLDSHRNEMLVSQRTRELGVPAYTAYLAELVRRVGGRVYFLREMQTLADIYRHIAETLRAQYTLGYYPDAAVRDGASSRSMARPTGWRTLGVEILHHPGARVSHRLAYYKPSDQ